MSGENTEKIQISSSFSIQLCLWKTTEQLSTGECQIKTTTQILNPKATD